MTTIKKGVYRFKDELTDFTSFGETEIALPIIISQTLKTDDENMTVSVVNSPISYSHIGLNYSSIDMPTIRYINPNISGDIVYGASEASLWDFAYLFSAGLGYTVDTSVKGYGQIITVTADTEVDDTFATWFSANTELVVEETSAVEITYKGEKIELSAGDVATLHIGGKKLTEDLVIKANEVTIPETPDNPLPIEVANETEMNTLLTTADVGSVYKYKGTSGTYENGALYVVEVVSE